MFLHWFSTAYLFLFNLAKSVIAGIKRVVRSCSKYVQHKITNLCELQRIIYGTLNGYERSSQVETSLRLSRNHPIQVLLHQIHNDIESKNFNYKRRSILFEQMITVLGVQKGINLSLHQPFHFGMRTCLISIYGLKLLKQKVYEIQHTQFKMGSSEDEDKLRHIWNNLMDEELPSISSEKWGDLGFQGKHPATDLRGVGMLGINCLLYLVHDYQPKGKEVANLSRHPAYGYPFGILSIHITFLACEIAESEAGKTHFYNKYEKFNTWHRSGDVDAHDADGLNVSTDYLMTAFYELYVALLFKFHKVWFEERPSSIMEFPSVMKKFKGDLYQKLAHPKCKIESELHNI